MLAVKLLFSDFPTELHDLVFESLDIEGVFNLSLTCQQFWSIGQKHLHIYFMSYLGRWAGQSIGYLVSDVAIQDYPPGMLIENENNKFSQYRGRRDVIFRVILPDILSRRFLFDKEYSGIVGPDRFHILGIIDGDNDERFFPRDQPWILRNLTTKEFVRSEAIALAPELIRGPKIGIFGFGEVILSRISWSADPSVGMVYDGKMHRGIWAGHRFDIATLARHVQGSKEEGWTDISEEVAGEMMSILEREYGADWRMTLLKKDIHL